MDMVGHRTIMINASSRDAGFRDEAKLLQRSMDIKALGRNWPKAEICCTAAIQQVVGGKPTTAPRDFTRVERQGQPDRKS